jgi:hypothetical protein
MMKFVAFALMGTCLTACVHTAGVDFRYPDTSRLVAGQTTEAEVEAMMGKPLFQNVLTVEPKADAAKTARPVDPAPIERTVKMIKYDFKKGPDKRELAIMFSDEKLCSVIFFSNFPEDSTDYDDSKVSLLKKGTTTEAEALAYFGPPRGRDDYPSIRDKTSHGLRYTYGVEGLPPVAGAKELVMVFDKNNVLQDFKFNSNMLPSR